MKTRVFDIQKILLSSVSMIRKLKSDGRDCWDLAIEGTVKCIVQNLCDYYDVGPDAGLLCLSTFDVVSLKDVADLFVADCLARKDGLRTLMDYFPV
jgi:hypothetical protein